jgi:hypothetical protein
MDAAAHREIARNPDQGLSYSRVNVEIDDRVTNETAMRR